MSTAYITAPRITYTVSLAQRRMHLYEVEMQIDLGERDRPTLTLRMPSWTPGAPLIRDYARHVQEFAAYNAGTALAWRKIAKDEWQIDVGNAQHIHITYRVYAHELTVRTNHLDDTHAFFNGTALFFYISERRNEPVLLQIYTPSQWRISTGLELVESPPAALALNANEQVSTFTATHYDELADCPVECGSQRSATFEVDGIVHEIAITGGGNEPLALIVRDLQRIVEAHRTLYGSLPYRRYVFLVHLTDRHNGGLEHRNSSANMLRRTTFATVRGYERFLALMAHEYFHVWNAKRIQPAVFIPINYRGETCTSLFWLLEGVTSYYDWKLMVQSGLMRPERWLELLGRDIVDLANCPGRMLQSLEQSSFDNWIKPYPTGENSDNSSVSFYLKGSLVALALDLAIRNHTDGAKSLDDVMRMMDAHCAQGEGISEAEGVLPFVEAVAGEQQGWYRAFFAHCVAGTHDPDFDGLLAPFGLRIQRHWSSGSIDRPPRWLGIESEPVNGLMRITRVRTDGPAYAAGLAPRDLLVALDGWRTTDIERLQTVLQSRAVGDTMSISFFRRDELLQVPVVIQSAPPDVAELLPQADADERQRRLRTEWLGATLR